MKKYLIIGFAALLATMSLNAQTSVRTETTRDTSKVLSDYNRFYIALNPGLYQFYGDVSSDVFFPGTMMKGKIPWTVAPRVGWDFNENFGVRASFGLGEIWAESNKPTIDAYFHSTMRDLQGEFVINLSNLVTPYIYHKRWNLSLYAGAGWMWYRSLSRTVSSDSIIGYTGYDAAGNKDKMVSERIYSYGASLGYKVTKHFDISADVRFQNTPTDLIDNDKNVLSEFDNYSSVTLGLTYYFGSKEQEWKWNPINYLHEVIMDSIAKQENQIVDLGNKINTCCENNNSPEKLADDDKDGIPNVEDLEPNTPANALVNWQGRRIPQIDTSMYAIVPKASLNPGAGKTGNPGPGTGAGTGTNPKNTSPGDGFIGTAMFFNSVYFPFDQSTIDGVNYREIVRVAQYMAAYPNVKMMISGNCDKHGSNEYNDALALRRTAAVKKVLINDFKIDPSRLVEEGHGKYKILSPSVDQINRRVDFFVIQ